MYTEIGAIKVATLERFPGHTFFSTGGIWSNRLRRFLKGETIWNGYRRVHIRSKHYLIHRLIAEAFQLKKTSSANVIHHINGNRSQNNIENLCWVTHSLNCQIAYTHHGRDRRQGERSMCAKLTRKNVLHVRKLRQEGKAIAPYARELGVTPEALYSVLSGKNWGHV